MNLTKVGHLHFKERSCLGSFVSHALQKCFSVDHTFVLLVSLSNVHSVHARLKTLLRTILYPLVERGSECFAQKPNTLTRPGFKPGPLDPQGRKNLKVIKYSV